MKKGRMVCPFTGGKCTKCSLYRGRHCYLFFSGNNRNPRDKKNMPGQLPIKGGKEHTECSIPAGAFLGAIEEKHHE